MEELTVVATTLQWNASESMEPIVTMFDLYTSTSINDVEAINGLESVNGAESVNDAENATNATNSVDMAECRTFMMDYGILSASVCAFAFVIGVVFCIFGYRLFKATMLLAGFIFGSEIVYFVCFEEDVLPLGGKIGLSVGAGLLCGLTAMFFNYVGLFVTGFQLGLVVMVAALIVIEQFYHPFTKWLPIGLILGIAVVCALLALRWQKEMTILSTCALGAALMLVCADYFLDGSRAARYAHDRMMARHSTFTMCWYSWLTVGLWPLVAALGAVIQWLLTARNFSHRPLPPDVVVGGRVVGKVSTRSVRPGAAGDAESQQTHYRQLYQIRRVNGDVISRSYIQQQQQQATCQSSQTQGLLSHGGTSDCVSDDTAVTLTAIADIDT